MKYKDWKISAFLIGVFVITRQSTVYASTTNGCALKYKKHVDEKPNFYLVTNTIPGICRIQHEDNATVNYHQDKKYPEEIRPETVIGGLNYDANNGTLLYWSKIDNVDHSRLYKIRLNDSHWEPVLHQDDDFRDMSYDWITKNLYIIMGSRSLMVAVNVEHPWNPTVILYERSQLTSLAVHPNRGYLFFVETSYWYGVQNKIYRSHLDGTNIVEFARKSSDVRYYIGSIVIDFHSDRIYWSVPAMNRIESADLNGEDVRTINNARVYSGQLDLSSRTLAVDKHYIYYRTSDANSIRRIDKNTETKDMDYELYNNLDSSSITEIVAFTYKSQKIRKDHPCRMGNNMRGGCQKYCIAVPSNDLLKRVCKCSFNEAVNQDGFTCVKKRPLGH